MKVSQLVLNGLEAVRKSGKTNMLDYNAVMFYAMEMGFLDAVSWLMDHKHEYCTGVFEGFEAGAES